MRKFTLLTGLSLCLAATLRAQAPVYIINGVRIPGCDPAGRVSRLLASIDPAVIENIEVLKGAMAVQQYGAEAANGVITITTTKGSVVVSPNCTVAAPPGTDAFTKFLYAPEFVIAHQQAIALTDKQRTAIQGAVKEIQPGATDALLRLASATERLTQLLSAPVVDEAGVLRELDETLALERTVKRAQMTLFVRVKNELSPAQQAQLDKLKLP